MLPKFLISPGCSTKKSGINWVSSSLPSLWFGSGYAIAKPYHMARPVVSLWDCFRVVRPVRGHPKEIVRNRGGGSNRSAATTAFPIRCEDRLYEIEH
jgi:hypothetical protein